MQAEWAKAPQSRFRRCNSWPRPRPQPGPGSLHASSDRTPAARRSRRQRSSLASPAPLRAKDDVMRVRRTFWRGVDARPRFVDVDLPSFVEAGADVGGLNVVRQLEAVGSRVVGIQ